MTTYALARSTAEISSSNLKQIVNEQVENSNLGWRWFTVKQRCNTDKSHIISASTSGSAEIRSMESPLGVRPYSSSEVQSRFKQLRVHNKLLTTHQTQSLKDWEWIPDFLFRRNGITTHRQQKRRSKGAKSATQSEKGLSWDCPLKVNITKDLRLCRKESQKCRVGLKGFVRCGFVHIGLR